MWDRDYDEPGPGYPVTEEPLVYVYNDPRRRFRHFDGTQVVAVFMEPIRQTDEEAREGERHAEM